MVVLTGQPATQQNIGTEKAINLGIKILGFFFFFLLKVFTWGRWGNNMAEPGNPLEIP